MALVDADTKAVIFDCGGVLGKDMRWDLILDQVDESLKETVNQTISKEWAKMRIDENYPEKDFWAGFFC
jgi:hypothetical protein